MKKIVFWTALVSIAAMQSVTRAEPVRPVLPDGKNVTRDHQNSRVGSTADDGWGGLAATDLAQMSKAMENARRLYAADKLAEAEAECRRAFLLSPQINGKAYNPAATVLMGDIYLRQGRNREALEWFLEAAPALTLSSDNYDLNIALVYCRLGDCRTARQFYSDDVVLKNVEKDDVKEYRRSLPGVDTPRDLEASILFARGHQYAAHGYYSNALEQYQAAGKLLPRNGLIAFEAGAALAELYRYAEARPYFRAATVHGRGFIARKAQKWLARHP